MSLLILAIIKYRTYFDKTRLLLISFIIIAKFEQFILKLNFRKIILDYRKQKFQRYLYTSNLKAYLNTYN
jgi:hypothetical protein